MKTLHTIDCYNHTINPPIMKTVIPCDSYSHVIHYPPNNLIMGCVVPQFSRMDPFHNGWKIMYEYE